MRLVFHISENIFDIHKHLIFLKQIIQNCLQINFGNIFGMKNNIAHLCHTYIHKNIVRNNQRSYSFHLKFNHEIGLIIQNSLVWKGTVRSDLFLADEIS